MILLELIMYYDQYLKLTISSNTVMIHCVIIIFSHIHDGSVLRLCLNKSINKFKDCQLSKVYATIAILKHSKLIQILTYI